MRLKKCILNTKAIVKDLIAENSGNNNFMEGRKSDHKHFILFNPHERSRCYILFRFGGIE